MGKEKIMVNSQQILLIAIKGHSIPEISDESGVAESTIRYWLRGEASPSMGNFEAVMNVLGWYCVWSKNNNGDKECLNTKE